MMEWLFRTVCVVFLLLAVSYYLTGAGGPMLLVVTLVPLCIALAFLGEARRSAFSPAGALTILLICLTCSTYLFIEFEHIRTYRVGIWNGADLLAGGVVALLVMEYMRRKYFPLFVLNAVLIAYAVYGALMPGILRHPGINWERVVTMSSLEMSTGIFDRLSQLGLTLIGAFILVLAVLRSFGSVDAVLKLSSHLVRQRPALLPQAAVVGSFAVAAVSGSGAANAATTGSATIPALIKAGFPRVHAAAVETASSLGGQLMPPLMGIAAFMMAEIIGVSYFEVAARGFAPAIIFFIVVSYSVHLLANRYRLLGLQQDAVPLNRLDWVRFGAYILAVVGLIVLMGVQKQHAMVAAQQVFVWLLAGMVLVHLLVEPRSVLTRLRDLAETFAVTTAELTVLLAALGILTAAFTVTGIPVKIGGLMMEMAAIHPALVVLTALVFGLVIGMGLPAAPTYLILAVVVAPVMIRAGFDPWAVHFFAFLVAVMGELTPPTSVTAAVAARIADAPFMATMFVALKICASLLLLTISVLVRPELVMVPGWSQVPAAALALVGCLAFARSTFGDDVWWIRAMVMAAGLVALFSPALWTAVLATTVVVTFFLVSGSKTQVVS